MRRSLVLSALCLSAGSLASVPKMQLDTNNMTLSGLSAGGYMAAQMLVANSDRFSGAGIIAAGPVYCAQNSLLTALEHCVNKLDSPIPVPELVTEIKRWESNSLVAPLDNLNKAKVWVLHGNKDGRVIEPVTDALVEQLKALAPDIKLKYSKDKPYAHHFPTSDNGHACDTSEAPFIGQCGFDAAGDMFRYLMPQTQTANDTANGKVYDFSQAEFVGDDVSGLAETGYVYVPAQCESGNTCGVHISLHGCNQFAGADNVGLAYIEKTGINRWADANNLVVLYPQTQASNLMPFNPQGCWDWWGYTDENYANQKSAQGSAILKMVAALSK